MKPDSRVQWTVAAALGVALLLGGLLLSGPNHPVAQIRVLDAAGLPVPGAEIKVDGLRTKPGPYQSSEYGWPTEQFGVPNDPVKTGLDGYAKVPYPKYVSERLETGTLCLSVSHPDFVSDRPERIVAAAPPAGTPWREWLKIIGDRVQRKALLVQTQPVVLQKGAILKLSVRADSPGPRETPLYGQVSGNANDDTNFWTRPQPSVLVTRRLGSGPHSVRAIRFDPQGWAWFSDVTNVQAVTGKTVEVVVDLKRGVALHGQLDPSTPRPITNGRITAQVWPVGCKPQDRPPRWHAWTTIDKDGTFALGSLPEGDLEIVALCDGFVSTNGPGKFQPRYPQKHVIGTNDLDISIGMEPTARLEVHVTDDKGQPLKDAHVIAWPNVRYGEWSAVVLASDLYNTADSIMSKPRATHNSWGHGVADFEGITDSAGMAILPNLPTNVADFYVEHPQFVLPAVLTPIGDKRRTASINLVAGITNHASVQMEKRDHSPITHY